MEREKQLEKTLRDCVRVIQESIVLFPVGKYPKGLPEVVNQANSLLGELYTSCGSCDSFLDCVIESWEILDSENQCYIDELRGTPACKDFTCHSVLCFVKEGENACN